MIQTQFFARLSVSELQKDVNQYLLTLPSPPISINYSSHGRGTQHSSTDVFTVMIVYDTAPSATMSKITHTTNSGFGGDPSV